MERLCFLMDLNPGQEQKYDQVHREMFPEMHDALVEAGYTNYTIFRLRTTVVGYAECVPDVSTVLDRMADHPVSARWAEALAGVARHKLELAEQVWRLLWPSAPSSTSDSLCATSTRALASIPPG